jgi:hypothetical protein
MRFPYRTPSALLAVILMTPAGLVVAQESETVYKCIRSDGRIIYSDQPCTGKMETQTITAPPAGSGGEAAREGINRLAREYDERLEAEQRAREEAERRALERRLSNPEVVVVAPWRDEPRYYPYYPRGGYVPPYDRYRDPAHGGMRLDDDGFSLWFDSGRPFPNYRPPPYHRPPRGDHPPRDPYSSDGRPIKEPGYSGRYPGGFPGYR